MSDDTTTSESTRRRGTARSASTMKFLGQRPAPGGDGWGGEVEPRQAVVPAGPRGGHSSVVGIIFLDLARSVKPSGACKEGLGVS